MLAASLVNNTMDLLPESPRSLVRLLAFVTISMILLAPAAAYSEEQVITAEASYTMGDGETPSFAEAMVLQKAKQQALEQAGTYVQSYTKMQNMELTADQITTIAGGVLQTEVLKQERSLVGNGVRFDISIKATVTTDRMEELAKKLRGEDVAQEYKKLQEQYSELMRELDSLKIVLAQTPSGPLRDVALETIRDREKTFRSLQQSETKFFETFVFGKSFRAKVMSQLSKKEAEKAIVDELVAQVVREGIEITFGAPEIEATLNNKKPVGMKIPVRLRATPRIRIAFIEAAKRLNGQVVETEYEGAKGTALRLGNDPEIISYAIKRIHQLYIALDVIAGVGRATCYFTGDEAFQQGRVGNTLWWSFFDAHYVSEPAYIEFDMRNDNGGFIFVNESPRSFTVKMSVPFMMINNLSSLTGGVTTEGYPDRRRSLTFYEHTPFPSHCDH